MKTGKKLLIGLLLLAFLTRVPYLIGNNIPFSFDHGRDSIAVLHLIKTYSLKFIGPWTSIQGLFFGPGWYYLLAPAYFFSGGNPLAAVITMLGLSLIEVWLAWKYFGIYEAVIFATAPAFIMLATGAANPFPMVLIGLLILIALKNPAKNLVILGFLAGLGFHFSSALSIFYLLIIPLILSLKKIKLKLKSVSLSLGAFIVTFVPQLLFEVKNNWLQTRSLIEYFSRGESQQITPGKIKLVTDSIIHELGLAVLPDITWLKNLSLVLLLTGIIYLILKKKHWAFWPEISLMILIPIIGFWWLHYNVWYVYGLLPVAVVATGQILKSSPKIIVYTYLGLMLINPLFHGWPKIQTKAGFLPIKLEALDYIYDQAQGKPFKSYQYLPNIYDYAYQYLYFWQGFKGRPLPVEFSYKPGEISYVQEKPDLLKLLLTPLRQGSEEPVGKIFLIIEKPENKWHYPLDRWLKEINYRELVSRKEFGPELEVWEVKP